MPEKDSRSLVKTKDKRPMAKYSNRMYEFPIWNLTANEIAFLLVVFYEVKNKGTETIKIPFSALKRLSNYKDSSSVGFLTNIKRFISKVGSLGIQAEDDKNIDFTPIFSRLRVKKDEKSIEASVNSYFVDMFNNFGKSNPYTLVPLEVINHLDSKYSRRLALHLAKFHDTKWWEVSVDEFKGKMGISKSYKNKDVMKYIIKPSTEELKYNFLGLECIPIHSGLDRRKIIGYKFAFDSFGRKYIDLSELSLPEVPFSEIDESLPF